MQENSNVKDRIIKICHEALNWDKSICPSGTWCRHSFATNLHNAGVDMDYISESMGHASSDHAITQIYIEHYPIDIQMQNILLKGMLCWQSWQACPQKNCSNCSDNLNTIRQ